MSIPTLAGSKSPAAKVDPVGPRNRAVIDEEFDRLHVEGKMEWTSDSAEFGFPCFRFRYVFAFDQSKESLKPYTISYSEHPGSG